MSKEERLFWPIDNLAKEAVEAARTQFLARADFPDGTACLAEVAFVSRCVFVFAQYLQSIGQTREDAMVMAGDAFNQVSGVSKSPTSERPPSP